MRVLKRILLVLIFANLFSCGSPDPTFDSANDQPTPKPLVTQSPALLPTAAVPTITLSPTRTPTTTPAQTLTLKPTHTATIESTPTPTIFVQKSVPNELKQYIGHIYPPLPEGFSEGGVGLLIYSEIEHRFALKTAHYDEMNLFLFGKFIEGKKGTIYWEILDILVIPILLETELRIDSYFSLFILQSLLRVFPTLPGLVILSSARDSAPGTITNHGGGKAGSHE